MDYQTSYSSHIFQLPMITKICRHRQLFSLCIFLLVILKKGQVASFFFFKVYKVYCTSVQKEKVRRVAYSANTFIVYAALPCFVLPSIYHSVTFLVVGHVALHFPLSVICMVLQMFSRSLIYYVPQFSALIQSGEHRSLIDSRTNEQQEAQPRKSSHLIILYSERFVIIYNRTSTSVLSIRRLTKGRHKTQQRRISGQHPCRFHVPSPRTTDRKPLPLTFPRAPFGIGSGQTFGSLIPSSSTFHLPTPSCNHSPTSIYFTFQPVYISWTLFYPPSNLHFNFFVDSRILYWNPFSFFSSNAFYI